MFLLVGLHRIFFLPPTIPSKLIGKNFVSNALSHRGLSVVHVRTLR